MKPNSEMNVIRIAQIALVMMANQELVIIMEYAKIKTYYVLMILNMGQIVVYHAMREDHFVKDVKEMANVLNVLLKISTEITVQKDAMDAVKQDAILRVIAMNLNVKKMNYMALDATKIVIAEVIQMKHLVENLEDNVQNVNLAISERNVKKDVIINAKQNYAVYLKNMKMKRKPNF